MGERIFLGITPDSVNMSELTTFLAQECDGDHREYDNGT